MNYSLHQVNMSKNSEGGFTLVEMIVAVFAFSIIMTIVGSIFVHSLVSQRRILNAQKVEENITSVMESMTREMRVAQPNPGPGPDAGLFRGTYNGFTISLPNTNCPGSAPVDTISFINSTGHDIVYDLVSQGIRRTVDGEASIMSSNNVEITSLKFCIDGMYDRAVPSSYGRQPRITIMATVRSSSTVQQITEDFQTTVSLRYLGIQ